MYDNTVIIPWNMNEINQLNEFELIWLNSFHFACYLTVITFNSISLNFIAHSLRHSIHSVSFPSVKRWMNVISLTSLLRHSFRTTASLSVPFFNCVEFMLLHVSFGLFFTHLQFLPFNQTTSFSYPRLSHQTGLLRSVLSISINFVSTSLILLKYFHCLIPLITVIIFNHFHWINQSNFIWFDLMKWCDFIQRNTVITSGLRCALHSFN